MNKMNQRFFCNNRNVHSTNWVLFFEPFSNLCMKISLLRSHLEAVYAVEKIWKWFDIAVFLIVALRRISSKYFVFGNFHLSSLLTEDTVSAVWVDLV